MIRVWPDSGHIEVLIDGLQLPTGLAVDAQGNVLVLELCASLQQPLAADWSGEAGMAASPVSADACCSATCTAAR